VGASVLRLRFPGVSHPFVFDARERSAPARPPSEETLRGVAQWLHIHGGFDPARTLPRVRLESPARIRTFRFTGLMTDDPDVASAVPRNHREVVAAYDALSRTIYLPEQWRGATPTEVSVLVHEMVHHLQHERKDRFACPEQAESAAYAAQDRWLQAFGRSLAADFEIDGFTLLAISQCMP
jgi:hypothetical protein